MAWNYRVLKHPDGFLAVHEVYYTNNNPDSCTVEPIDLSGDDLKHLKSILKGVQKALEKPILNYEDFK